MSKACSNLVKVLYSLIWAFGVTFSGFFAIFFPSNSEISVKKIAEIQTDSLSLFILPVLLIIAIFMIDVCYKFFTERTINQKTTFGVMCCITSYMIFLVFAIVAQNLLCQVIWIIILWSSLVLMKILTTSNAPILGTEDVIPAENLNR